MDKSNMKKKVAGRGHKVKPGTTIEGCYFVGVERAAVEVELETVRSLARAAEENAKTLATIASRLTFWSNGSMLTVGVDK